MARARATSLGLRVVRVRVRSVSRSPLSLSLTLVRSCSHYCTPRAACALLITTPLSESPLFITPVRSPTRASQVTMLTLALNLAP